MMFPIILLPILIPLTAALTVIFLPKNSRSFQGSLTFVAAAFNFVLTAKLFNKELLFNLPWLGKGMDFSLRLYQFSGFIMLSAGFFALLISLYSLSFLRDKNYAKHFYAYFLVTLAFVNGALLSDNLILLLFFWEGLLLTLFGMIAITKPESFKTATKAFIIVGITDLCLMSGIALAWFLSGTLTISKIHLSSGSLASLAFIFLIIGAISKAGSMPFHSWIPDAADDASLPFMAFLPAAVEKLLGIYFLTRITLDMFALKPGSWLSPLLMIIGSLTIILAVMMALVQKEYKRLLSYHAISQVGYMILGIGTCVPVGIIGGLFHMVNNALYKSCLFLTGGSVEKQTGTTDLENLGGLRLKMPVTCACFIITALAISGVPPFNGFFSKELVYEGALERGKIFYLAAILGSFFTAASFLKLGHAAFFGKIREEHKKTKEAPLAILIPMIVIALTCIIFGLFNYIPIRGFIQPVLGERLEGHNFSGFPANIMLTIATVLVLLAALIHHLLAVKIKGSALKAADHIRYAPMLGAIYDAAKKRFFDPYEIWLKISTVIAKFSFRIDRGIDWVYESFSVGLASIASMKIRKLHDGSYARYISWAFLGLILVIIFFFKGIK
ncbi:MAG: proton-conducting transporter membrane subunit [Candidatus Omnitrophota bacterium]|jgi:NADH-quinone oxidoreductase subunit L